MSGAFTEEQEALMRRLLKAGVSTERVAEEIGATTRKVRRFASDRSLERSVVRTKENLGDPSQGRAGAELLSLALERSRSRYTDDERAKRDRGGNGMPSRGGFEGSYGVSTGDVADAI